MRIIKLHAENVKRLKAIDITPTGDLVRITGKNGAGKSSCLDAIAMAIRGDRELPAEPIRHGEDRAEIRLDLGDIIVRKVIRPSGTFLEVTNADGLMFKSPQALLRGLGDAVGFDPLAFAEMDARKRRDHLLAASGCADQVREIEARRKTAFDERTVANRILKEMEATQAAQGPKEPEPTVRAPEEIRAMIRVIDAGKEEAKRLAAERKHLNTRVETWTQSIDESNARIEALEKEIVRVREKIEAMAKGRTEDIEAIARIDALGGPPEADTSALEEELQQSDEALLVRGRNRDRDDLSEKVRVRASEAETLTRAIEECDRAKETLLAGLALPVSGVTVTDVDILVNGVPFDQCATSEKIRMSTAVAMALNPKLRVILIRDGSHLDSESMRIIAEMASGKGFQVWVEAVDETGKVGIVIEDGMVLSVNPEQEGTPS